MNFEEIINENWQIAILSFILAIFSIFFMGNLLSENGALETILGYYITILSIIVSATFVSAQIAISKFGAEIWDYYKSNTYVKFYFWVFPALFMLGGSLLVLKPEMSNIDIFKFYFTPYPPIHFFLKYLIIDFLTILLIFLITFSVTLIPKYLKMVMDILNPKEQIIQLLRLISEVKSYGSEEKIYLKTIKNILNDLHENESYEVLKSCLKILSEEYFENIIKNKEMENFNEFIKDYTNIIKELALKEYPLGEGVIDLIITTLADISIVLIENDLKITDQIKSIDSIFNKLIEKWPVKNDKKDRFGEDTNHKNVLHANSVVISTLNAYQKIINFLSNKESLSENQKSALDNTITWTFAILNAQIKQLKNYYDTNPTSADINYDKYCFGIEKSLEIINKILNNTVDKSIEEKKASESLLKIIEEYDRIVNHEINEICKYNELNEIKPKLDELIKIPQLEHIGKIKSFLEKLDRIFLIN
ncbi:hypothetical protein [Methanococcus maripaludis]|uniref:Uncharacterized protein n=1 Tax=Methanococcus maripaludis TaxID=39152 RepID=A0A7J9PSK7_METMI|nr:hypothetical protein [Methanococcus maripaludis]MBA2864489.1 hypothetical protein [Methanococcus maripaludis]